MYFVRQIGERKLPISGSLKCGCIVLLAENSREAVYVVQLLRALIGAQKIYHDPGIRAQVLCAIPYRDHGAVGEASFELIACVGKMMQAPSADHFVVPSCYGGQHAYIQALVFLGGCGDVTVFSPPAKRGAFANGVKIVVVRCNKIGLHLLVAARAVLPLDRSRRDVDYQRASPFARRRRRPIKLHRQNKRKCEIAEMKADLGFRCEKIRFVALPIERAVDSVANVIDGGKRENSEQYNQRANTDCYFVFLFHVLPSAGWRLLYVPENIIVGGLADSNVESSCVCR